MNKIDLAAEIGEYANLLSFTENFEELIVRCTQ